MPNTNTVAMNDYAVAIAENRWIASAQLTGDDFTSTETTKASVLWKQYRQTCDILVNAYWDSLKPGKAIDDDLVGTAIAGLFKFFGTDAKATTANRNRLLTCCVTFTRNQSDAMKNARKDKKKAKDAYDKAKENEESEEKIAELKADYDAKTAIVEDMEAQPHNVWYDKKPLRDKNQKATAKCRKLIEDEIADIMTERANMSEEAKAQEQQELDDQRLGREIRKKKEAKQAKAEAQANTEETKAE